jgi:protein-S-isoprenylcysteine O-methyltransferase Ste14
MKNLLKQIVSFILPVTVLILVPLYIERNISVKNFTTLLTGLMIMCAGLFVMTMTISAFIRIGKGTLAPWNPTKKLITSGMYRQVRNPMITGVLTVLTGESIAVMSLKILLWAGIFFLINTVYFILIEEPGLEKRFGDEYREYKRNVPRWIPRLKPFKPGSDLN